MHGRPIKEQPWLNALNDAETFNREVNPFFGAIGDQEVSLPLFENERVFCREKGVNYIQKIYSGAHEWRVWRIAVHDFFRMLFR
jgi:enterochelin esterase-like enzyme